MNIEQPDYQPNTSELEKKDNSIRSSIDRIKTSGIFKDSYLNQATFVFSINDSSDLIFKNSSFSTSAKNDFPPKDFEKGLRTDYISLVNKDEYEKFDIQDPNTFSDQQFIQTLFYDQHFPYDEFIAHETAHNLFDIAYTHTHGEFDIYEIRNNQGNVIDTETDCSPEYLQKMNEKIKKLLAKYNINLNVDKFQLSRQKIAEIFALTIQQEYAKKSNSPFMPEHEKLKTKTINTLSNIEANIARLNKESNRHISIDDFYTENHILSFIIAPLLETEFPNLSDRLSFFEIDTNKILNT